MIANVEWIQLQHVAHSKQAICLIQGLEMSLYDSMEEHSLTSTLAREFPGCDVYGLVYPSRIFDHRGFDSYRDKVNLYQNFATSLVEMVSMRYDRIVFLGFCLGGFFLSKSLPFLHTDFLVCSRCSLLLIDTPFDLPKSGPSQWLEKLMNVLGIEKTDLQENAQFWKDSNRPSPHIIFGNRIFAMVSTKKSWISSLRSDYELDSKRLLKLNIHHIDLFDSAKEGNLKIWNVLADWIRKQLYLE